MNNVLVIVDTSESSFWLAYYAIGLTSRISANVSILMINDNEYARDDSDDDEWIGLPEKRLESLLAESHSDTAHINYYVANGKMEIEIPNFIKENNITSLFIGKPKHNRGKPYLKFMTMLESVSATTHCKVEVVENVTAYTKRK